ncbi:MAG: DegV family protein, partial [Clostridia bacterium]
MAVILSADRTCDLSDALREKYDVRTIPFHVMLDNKEYLDGVDIVPEDIYRVYYDKHILPQTSAINTGEYLDYFRPF